MFFNWVLNKRQVVLRYVFEVDFIRFSTYFYLCWNLVYLNCLKVFCFGLKVCLKAVEKRCVEGWRLAADGLFTLIVSQWRSYLLLMRSCRAGTYFFPRKSKQSAPGCSPWVPPLFSGINADKRPWWVKALLLCCNCYHFPTWGIKHRPKWGNFCSEYRLYKW